jgi:hypothetical protein
VADDFGYYGYVTGDDHSMLVSPAAPDIERMQIEEFATAQRLDYVRGQKRAWTRQVAFVKDADPQEANYFVFCDTLDKPAAATWRLWLTCEKVALRAQTAEVKGKEDVDTDVCFVPTRSNLLRSTVFQQVLFQWHYYLIELPVQHSYFLYIPVELLREQFLRIVR